MTHPVGAVRAVARAPDKLISTIERNAREQFRVQIRSTKDGLGRAIDLRLFIANGVGVMEPTAKGVSIQLALISPMIEALQRAEREAAAEVLITDANASALSW